MAGEGLRKKHRRRRVEQVLDAAEALFNRDGYDATRIEAIAQSASVAPATIYNYFDTKPNIVMALALRHVRAALPERRAFLRNLPADPLLAVLAFERLLAEQAVRHLSRECWRVILASQHLEPQGRASRTGARLNELIRRQYVRMIRTYQERGAIRADIDPAALSSLIVGVTTADFSRFVASSSDTVEDLLRKGEPHLRLILEGLVQSPGSRRPARAAGAL